MSFSLRFMHFFSCYFHATQHTELNGLKTVKKVGNVSETSAICCAQPFCMTLFPPLKLLNGLLDVSSLLRARCFNEESCLSLKQLEGYLVVLQPDAPQISLSGVGPHLARPAPEFEGPRGVPLFPELRIVCSLSHAVNTAAQGMEGGGESNVKSPPAPRVGGLIKICGPCLSRHSFLTVT